MTPSLVLFATAAHADSTDAYDILAAADIL